MNSEVATDPNSLVTLTDIRAAALAIHGHVHRTVQGTSTFLNSVSNTRVSLKLELFQKTGSFKVRGVINALRQLTPEECAAGVISLSAGNHAQALAWGAAKLGIKATIVMPATAVASKVAATRAYGGHVVQTDADLMMIARELQLQHGLTMVHPFDDKRVIAGQGTVGLEIFEDVPEVDVVLVACGGGGLVSGVATAIKSLKPGVRVIAIEPEGASAMALSVGAGSPQRLPQMSTVADGLAAPFAGTHTLAHVQRYVDEVIVIPDSEILAGMRVLMERCKLFVEPAAGAAIAPLLNGRVQIDSGATVVPIVCGGNIDLERLKTMIA
ncbi:MAG: threonine/serine dehydratase [Gemmatimonadota bacterium]|nr:threonine/serine dehydratase [Gemmatimonadota bacterium]